MGRDGGGVQGAMWWRTGRDGGGAMDVMVRVHGARRWRGMGHDGGSA